MTILVSDLGDTVIGGFKRGLLENDLGLTSNSQGKPRGRFIGFFTSLGKQMKHGTEVSPEVTAASQELEGGQTSSHDARETEESDSVHARAPRTIEELASERLSGAQMMRDLAFAIRRAADDIKTHPDKQYTYEEWVEFTRLIRFSKLESVVKPDVRGSDFMDRLAEDEDTDGIIEWDWLGKTSPMTSDQTESEWLLDRLCESLLRIFKKGDLLVSGQTIGQASKQEGQLGSGKDSGGHIERSSKEEQEQRHQEQTNIAAQDDHQDIHAKAGKMHRIAHFFHGNIDEINSEKWSKRGQTRQAEMEDADNELASAYHGTTNK